MDSGSSTAGPSSRFTSTSSPRAPSLANARPDRSPSLAPSKRTSSRHAVNNTTYLDGVGARPSPPPSHSRRRPKDKGKKPMRERDSDRRQGQQRRTSHATAGPNSTTTSNHISTQLDSTRHSHGLSWSSTTRDSVVDNLLLSLDNLSTQHLPSTSVPVPNDDEFEREKVRLRQMPTLPQYGFSTPSTTRQRGHTYSSSVSSGYDGHAVADSPASKFSASGKGRRSNSSSNFQMHSTRGHPSARKMNGSGRISSDTMRHAGSVTETSDGESVGHGSSISGAERLHRGGRRSVSMDHIYTNPSVLERGRPVPSVYSRYESPQLTPNDEAAPEPGVPAGPRKQPFPMASGPVYVDQATPKPSAVRKMNTQGDLRASARTNPSIPQHIQDQANDFVRANSMQGSTAVPTTQGPPVSMLNPDLQASRNKAAPSPQRERPGFFKRFFGPTSRSVSSQSIGSDPRGSMTYLDKVAPPSTRTVSQPHKDVTVTPRPETRKVSKEQAPPVSYPPSSLNKKSSSFFRRRKKSTSEMTSPPPLPLNNKTNAPDGQPVPRSPGVSSLRKVMDPYLSGEGSPDTEDFTKGPPASVRPFSRQSATEDSDSLDIFHSGYTPPPDASLGRRDPMRRDAKPRTSMLRDQDQESPRSRLKIRKRKPEAAALTVSSVTNLEQATDSNAGNLATEVSVDDVADKGGERPAVSRASTGERIIASRNNPASDEIGRKASLAASGDEWVVLQQSAKSTPERPRSKKSERLVLQPTEAEERTNSVAESGLEVPAAIGTSPEASSATPATVYPARSTGVGSVYHSATSLQLPSVQVDGYELPRESVDHQQSDIAGHVNDEEEEYKKRARKIYAGDEEDVMRAEAAAWLGETNTLSSRTLQAFMQLFDFSGKTMLAALRRLCSKLLLRGETQQFDRIITALSDRWCECNPNHGFKAQDVVHTILYSLILLNTDLHMADIEEKMSRSAYVKNTLPTIRRVVTDAAPNAFEEHTVRPSPQSSRPSLPWRDSSGPMPASPTFAGHSTPTERTSLDVQRPTVQKRLSFRPGMLRSDSDNWSPDSPGGGAANALVNNPWTGTVRGWEGEIETMLKAFYSSIRADPLPLMGGSEPVAADRNLSVANFPGLKRSGSVVSKAPSENASFMSKPGFRTLTMGWQSRANRSRPKLYPASTVGSSRTSFDDNNSMWSPAGSSSWSKNSFAKTLTSASMSSLGHHLSPTGTDYKHSIGFANALSHAIIREEVAANGLDDVESIAMPNSLLDDEELALEGAPWAKEGLVKHKHHMEAPDRKAKERSWNDCFAVLGKGKLTLFAFNTSTKSHSMGRKAHAKSNASRAGSTTAPTVGGGDWMGNAEQLDTFVLRQTIASVLPRPGYSKARPYVWALSLPSGAVHLFQVGTPEIAEEFTTTANYWSARLSKEPLSGGVSNVEYGWSSQAINPALIERSESHSTTSPPSSMQNARMGHMHSSSISGGPGSGTHARSSLQSSLRGSFDAGFGATARTRLPGDKISIAEWQPPTQSMMASQLLEVDQLKALTTYVASVEEDLARHSELKHAIELAYTPRHNNSAKAVANWQRKSDYLLREIVKFRTYMDSLEAAQRAKEGVYARKRGVAAAAEAESGGTEAVDGVDGEAVEVEDGAGRDGGRDVGHEEEEDDVRNVTPRQSSHAGVPTVRMVEAV